MRVVPPENTGKKQVGELHNLVELDNTVTTTRTREDTLKNVEIQSEWDQYARARSGCNFRFCQVLLGKTCVFSKQKSAIALS